MNYKRIFTIFEFVDCEENNAKFLHRLMTKETGSRNFKDFTEEENEKFLKEFYKSLKVKYLVLGDREYKLPEFDKKGVPIYVKRK